MNTSSVAPGTPLNELPFPELQDCCEDELAHYRRNPSRQESVCCLEIVRRAAANQDDAAFAALLHISRPVIQKRCPTDLRDIHDELEQEVATRLFRKFYRAEQPFQVTTFAAYLVYLQLTCFSAVHEVRAHQAQHHSLDNLRTSTGFEPAAPLPTDEVERRMLLERWLELLPDQKRREVFHRRFALGETPAAIAQALGIAKKDVFRLVEQTIRLLKDMPEVREMLEA